MKGDSRMVKLTRNRARFMGVVLLLTALAGCTGDDPPDGAGRPGGDNADEAVEPSTPVIGGYGGEVTGTEAFGVVVTAPADAEDESGAVQVYLSDGRGLSEWFSGPISD